HLIQLVRSLHRHLPGQLDGLLSHARFAEGSGALARLGEESRLAAAVAALAEAEAEWLGGLLHPRWAAIGEPLLDPAAVSVAPGEVWVGAEPARVPVEVVVIGADPPWEAVWDGATAQAGARAVVVVDPAASTAACRVHVRARTAEGRVALGAA